MPVAVKENESSKRKEETENVHKDGVHILDKYCRALMPVIYIVFIITYVIIYAC